MNASEPAPVRPAVSSWYPAFSIGLAAAFLLGGYECVRSTSNTLFKQAYGPQNLPVIMALMPMGLAAVLYGYGRLLSCLGPRRALRMSSVLSALCFVACYLGCKAGFAPATGLLYVLREVYVVLLIEQYWSFLNSTLGVEAAKKLNGPICGLGSVGSILGGLLVSELSESMGAASMVLFGAFLILPAAFCSDLAYRRCGEPARSEEEKRHGHGHLALGLFRKESLLALLLVIVLATQVVSAALELAFQHQLSVAYPNSDQQNAFSGRYFAYLNGAAFAMQFVAAPIALRWAPLRWIHVLMPAAHMATAAFVFQSPTLFSAGLSYMVFKTLDYSLFRAAKEILYIPFSFDVRYRSKEIIDVFGYRFGKGGMALAIKLIEQAKVVFTDGVFACVAASAAAVWLVLIVPVTKKRDTGDLP